MCVQLGHSGPKGSTQLGWETMDAPLVDNNWPLLAASSVAWSANNSVPKAMDKDDMQKVKADFVTAAQRAIECGFDMLEVHCAHGYLLSSFITPVSNKRDDEFGGSLENRMRYPLAVVSAVKSVMPAGMPLSVRISANDWVGDAGITPVEAVEIAKAFKAIGVDIIDVSAGQTSVDAQPVYGRMFQTPFADRIRHEVDIPTMAVGNIFEADHVNSILMAGRADLVCLGRPHLANANWTNQAAIALGDQQQAWPLPYLAGREQAYRLAERAEQMAIRA